jgi:hypothetical protein
MRPGFWEMMFDSDYRRRSDINDALYQSQSLSGDVASLQAQIGRLQENQRDLSVTVAAMLELLVDKQQLDPDRVRERAEAMLAELRKPPPGSVVAAPPEAIAHPKPPPLNTQPLTCTKCGRSVPANLTLMTENGPVCDPGCP